MALFDGTDTPKWQRPSDYSLESERAAAAIGQTFGSAWNSAIKNKEDARQADMQNAIKETELGIESEKVTASKAAMLAKGKLEANTLTGYAALADIVSRVGTFKDGWNDPKFGQSFWETVRAYPSVMENPRFSDIEKNFDNAAKAAQNEKLWGDRIAAQKERDAAAIKQRAAAEVAVSGRPTADMKNAEYLRKLRERAEIGDGVLEESQASRQQAVKDFKTGIGKSEGDAESKDAKALLKQYEKNLVDAQADVVSLSKSDKDYDEKKAALDRKLDFFNGKVAELKNGNGTPIVDGATKIPRGTKSPAEKAAIANDLAKQHPDWSRERILQEVNK